MNATENLTELELLKKEVADLKRQFRELSQFVCINGTMSGKKKLVIVCSSINLCDPDDDDHTQASLWAGQDGPEFHMYDKQENQRVAIKVNQVEGGSIQLFEPEEKLAAHIGRDNLGMSSMGVFDKGNPRAAIKASENMGVVSAVHNGGQARVTMSSQENSGDIMLLNPDMRVAVKLSTQGQHDEGFITVNHSNGKAAVILSALPDYGCVMLNDRAGQMKYSLPDPKNI
jgi:hypothetical protein